MQSAFIAQMACLRNELKAQRAGSSKEEEAFGETLIPKTIKLSHPCTDPCPKLYFPGLACFENLLSYHHVFAYIGAL
jgi:hypothetical protein